MLGLILALLNSGGTQPLRKRPPFSSILALTFVFTAEAMAQDHGDPIRHAATDTAHNPGGVFVDLMAADFFESSLRLSQARRIEAQTAKRYLSLDEAGRARFRAERKRQWRALSEAERQTLRGAKRPRFDNLDEAQKQTFRRIAADTLGDGSQTPALQNGI